MDHQVQMEMAVTRTLTVAITKSACRIPVPAERLWSATSLPTTAAVVDGTKLSGGAAAAGRIAAPPLKGMPSDGLGETGLPIDGLVA